MSTLKLCRVCLNKNVRGYSEFIIEQYYEQLMGNKVNTLDGVPCWFCFECSAMLLKFNKFKVKCSNGQKVLEKLLKHGPITYEAINKVDRATENLQSSIKIIQTNKHVKTCAFKHKYGRRNYRYNNTEPNGMEFQYSLDQTVGYTEKLVKNEFMSIEDKSFHDELQSVEMVDMNNGPQQIFVLIPEPELVKPTESTQDQVKTDLESAFNEVGGDFQSMEDHNNIIRDIMEKEIEVKGQKLPGITKKFKFERKKQDLLTADYWKKYQMTEEEALIEFKKKEYSEKFTKMSHKCMDCYKGFSKHHILMRHINFKHKESLGPYKCRFCRMRFRLRHYMTHHMQEHYRVYHCLLCDKKFSVKNSANLHERYHSGRLIKCKYCGEEFKHQSTYYTHVRELHRSAHVCRVCGASFVSEMGLTQHTNIKHYDIQHTETAASETQVTMKIYCSKCDIKFLSQQAYDEHLVNSDMHDEASDTNNLKGGKLLPAAGKGRVSRRVPTTCKYCGLKLESREAGRRHHLAEHPEQVERVICHICGASLREPSMVSHMNSHTRARLFPCDLCGRECISRMVLKRHMVTHTGEKPYPCALCDKRFTQSASLQLHHKTFHLKMPYPKRNRRMKTPSEG